MKKFLHTLFEEFVLVFKGKTLDVIIPPLLYFILLQFFTLVIALIGSIFLAILLFSIRYYNKNNTLYAFTGLFGTLFAAFMTYISNNASNFFLPDIIGTSILIIVTIISLVLKRPIAAYVSHITRNWDMSWFLRDDVLPAYMEVSIFWLIFFTSRLLVEVYLYITSTVEQLIWANIILGFPLTIIVLLISYVYGIWRLHKLNGPGIDEYKENKEPPYRGQIRGF